MKERFIAIPSSYRALENIFLKKGRWIFKLPSTILQPMGLSTLTISKNLEAKGFTASQAEGLAEVVVESVESEKKDLVTKEYLKSEVTILESRLESKMVAQEIRIIKWMVGLYMGGLFVGIGFLSGFMYFLLKYFLKAFAP